MTKLLLDLVFLACTLLDDSHRPKVCIETYVGTVSVMNSLLLKKPPQKKMAILLHLTCIAKIIHLTNDGFSFPVMVSVNIIKGISPLQYCCIARMQTGHLPGQLLCTESIMRLNLAQNEASPVLCCAPTSLQFEHAQKKYWVELVKGLEDQTATGQPFY